MQNIIEDEPVVLNEEALDQAAGGQGSMVDPNGAR